MEEPNVQAEEPVIQGKEPKNTGRGSKRGDCYETLTTTKNKRYKAEEAKEIIFQDGDRKFTAEFEDGRLKCFYCPKIITQVKRHFGTHKNQIQNWSAMEEFCLEVSTMWRKEAVSKAQKKYEKTVQGKETRKEYEKSEQGKERCKEYDKTI